MCDVGRDDGAAGSASLRRCLACGILFEGRGRALYHSRACQQQAYRLRRRQGREPLLAALATELRARRALVEQTVYECARCEERYLGDRRCPTCNLMCRKLGLGGRCPHCDEPMLVIELLGGA
jgi:ssDNA-binding Zn-finger/Zn-ribbon topoisomerase 1